jgi:hypothetical protein
MLKKIFSASSEKDSIGNSFRIKRFRFLAEKLDKFPKPIHILDIGGTVKYWELRGLHNNDDFQITLVNLISQDSPYSNIRITEGDATDLSIYADQSFDLAFSNSVIEHLTDWDKQESMAREVMRVGKYYFVQTPNRFFPLEPHFLFPFFQFLPYRLQYFILTRTKLSRGKRWKPERASTYIREIRLLSLSEMKKLFKGSKVYLEKAGGMVKSFTLHNLPD